MSWVRLCLMLLLGSLFPLLAMAADEDPFGDDIDTPITQSVQ